MTGTFYRPPAPDGRADQTVRIVEVMKPFNSIAAGRAGTVVEICAENETLLDADEALIWIEPKDQVMDLQLPPASHPLFPATGSPGVSPGTSPFDRARSGRPPVPHTKESPPRPLAGG